MWNKDVNFVFKFKKKFNDELGILRKCISNKNWKMLKLIRENRMLIFCNGKWKAQENDKNITYDIWNNLKIIPRELIDLKIVNKKFCHYLFSFFISFIYFVFETDFIFYCSHDF